MLNKIVVRVLLVIVVTANVVVAVSAAANGVHFILQEKTLSSDSSLFAEVARVDLNGGTLYLDRWDNKPPVVFWYLEVFFRLLGASVQTVTVAIVAHDLVLGAMIGLLAYALTRSRLAGLCALLIGLVYSIIIQKVETTVLMSALGVCAMTLRIVARGRLVPLLLAGAIFALGVLAKQPLVVELPVFLLFAAYYAPGHRRAAIAGVIAGILGAALAFCLWLVTQGNADAFFRHVVFDTFSYVFTTDGKWHGSSFGDRFDETWQRFLPILPFVLLAIGVLLARARSRKLAIVLSWLILTAAAASTTQDLKFAYFIQILPPVIVLIAMATDWGYRRYPAILVVVLAGLCFALTGFSAEFVRSSDREDDGELVAAAAIVQEHSLPGDCLWVWSQYSDVSFVAGRASCASLPMNTAATNEEQFDTRRNQNELLLDLLRRPPKLHILVDDDSYFPQLKRFAARYRKQLLFENDFQIYQVDMSSWHPLPAAFGDEIALVGYDLPVQARYCLGDTLPMALTWRQLRASTDTLQMRVDLADEQGKSQIDYLGPVSKDDPPFEPLAAGDIWLGSTFRFNLPQSLTPGEYTFTLTVFPADAPNQPLTAANGVPQFELQPIRIETCGPTDGIGSSVRSVDALYSADAE